MNRRESLGTITAAGLLGMAASSEGAGGPDAPATTPAAPALGAPLPTLQFIYECDVTISEALDFGATVEGKRRVIPITGGSFKGPDVKGQVLSIGADWNLSRSDGASSVEAAYYLRTDDGVIIRVVNKGVGGAARPNPPPGGERFFMFTSPTFEAPSGKYDWFNKSIFVGTLGARPDTKNAVLIRVFKLT
jgi:hypothetical protein